MAMTSWETLLFTVLVECDRCLTSCEYTNVLDRSDFQEELQELGWKITKDGVFCADCAKEMLNGR